jgi:DNA-binding transcriptional regulator YdaS (Cro superfamily)
MKLSDWVAERKRERRALLIEELGVTHATITGYCAEPPSFKPSAERMVKIERITGGAVTPQDWFEEAGA